MVETVQRRDTSRRYRICDGHQSTGGYSSRDALKAGARYTRRDLKQPRFGGVCGKDTGTRLFENVVFFLHVFIHVEKVVTSV